MYSVFFLRECVPTYAHAITGKFAKRRVPPEVAVKEDLDAWSPAVAALNPRHMQAAVIKANACLVLTDGEASLELSARELYAEARQLLAIASEDARVRLARGELILETICQCGALQGLLSVCDNVLLTAQRLNQRLRTCASSSAPTSIAATLSRHGRRQHTGTSWSLRVRLRPSEIFFP